MSEALMGNDIAPVRIQHFLRKDHEVISDNPGFWNEILGLQNKMAEFVAAFEPSGLVQTTISKIRDQLFLHNLGLEYVRPDMEMRERFKQKGIELPQDAAVVLLLITAPKLNVDLGTLMIAFNDERILDLDI